jgi:hypothetical protein
LPGETSNIQKSEDEEDGKSEILQCHSLHFRGRRDDVRTNVQEFLKLKLQILEKRVIIGSRSWRRKPVLKI